VKRCFVISPIGPEGSQTREHADDVFDYIIKPAMEECGIQAFRSDHLQEPGKITEQMFREILTDDLAIAVLTGHNANVFYELAIAHAAGRPVVVLIEKGESLPFDIRDLRCVYYDLKPRSLFDKVYLKQVVAHVHSLESSGWKVPTLFGKAVMHLGNQDDLNPFSFYRTGSEFGTPDTWLQLLRETEKVFEIMGIHLGPWRGGKGFSDLLAKKAKDGCAIRILLMHPDNPTLPDMINETLTEVDLEDVTREINEMAKYFARIAAKCPNISLRQIRRGTLHCQTTRTDGFAVYLPYLYSRRRRYCPLWQCKAGAALYDVVIEEFEGLWKVNDTVS
jgi:hypothetical protein